MLTSNQRDLVAFAILIEVARNKLVSVSDMAKQYQIFRDMVQKVCDKGEENGTESEL